MLDYLTGWRRKAWLTIVWTFYAYCGVCCLAMVVAALIAVGHWAGVR